MSTPAKTARERAEVPARRPPVPPRGARDRGLAPPLAELSQVAPQDAAAGLAVLFDVDRDVVDAYDRWSRAGSPRRCGTTSSRRSRAEGGSSSPAAEPPAG